MSTKHMFLEVSPITRSDTKLSDQKELLKKKESSRISILSYIDSIITLSLISILGTIIVWHLLSAVAFQTGYADWLIQAFRVRIFAAYGLISWSPAWSNGIGIWRAYQFVPHAITAFFLQFTNLEVARVMVILTLAQFFLVRFIIYFLLRSKSVGNIASLISVIVSYAVGQYWGGVNDYSILFGFTAFPVYVWMWINYTQNRLTYWFPFFLGLSFYIHPLLGIYSCSLWFLGLIMNRSQKIQIKSLSIQLAILIVSSSLFWVQHLFGHTGQFSSQFFLSLVFFKQTISNFSYMGASGVIFISLILGWIGLASLPRGHSWSGTLMLYSTLWFFAVLIGTSVELPKFIATTQYTRGVSFIAFAVAIGVGPIIQKIVSSRSTSLKVLLVVFLSLACVESLWISSRFSPGSLLTVEDPISVLIAKYPQYDIANSRVWTPFLDEANYKSSLSVKYPVSYMTHSDSNQVSVRLSSMLLYNNFQESVPKASMSRIKDYLRITNTNFLVFEKSSPFTKTLLMSPDKDFEDLGDIDLKKSAFRAFKFNLASSDALLFTDSQKDLITPFPITLDPVRVKDQSNLDDYVTRFAQNILPNGSPIPVSYPNPEQIDITLPKNRTGNTIYVATSYSSLWTAKANSSKLKISDAGPHFLKIVVPSDTPYALISLVHSWPTSWYISIFGIMSIGIALALIEFKQLLN